MSDRIIPTAPPQTPHYQADKKDFGTMVPLAISRISWLYPEPQVPAYYERQSWRLNLRVDTTQTGGERPLLADEKMTRTPKAAAADEESMEETKTVAPSPPNRPIFRNGDDNTRELCGGDVGGAGCVAL